MGAQMPTAPLALLNLLCPPLASCPLIFSPSHTFCSLYHPYIMASASCTRAQKAAYNALHPGPSSTPTAIPSSPILNLPPSQNSSASDLSSEFTLFVHKMPASSKKHIIVCKQEGSKCPVLHPGDLDAEVF